MELLLDPEFKAEDQDRLFSSTWDLKRGCTKSHPRTIPWDMRSVSCTHEPNSRCLKPAKPESVPEGNDSIIMLDQAWNPKSCLCEPPSCSQNKHEATNPSVKKAATE